MTKATKLGIIVSVTVLMSVGFTLMAINGIWIPCMILAVIWTAHIVYFVFGVRTINSKDDNGK